MLLLAATPAPPVISNQKLIIACWATAIVLILMAVVFMRSNRRHFALAVLPLTIPSIVHLVSGFLANTLDPAFAPITSVQIRILADLIAALVACLLVGLTSILVSKKRKTRLLFAIACALFIIVFSSFLLMSSVVQFVPLTA